MTKNPSEFPSAPRMQILFTPPSGATSTQKTPEKKQKHTVQAIQTAHLSTHRGRIVTRLLYVHKCLCQDHGLDQTVGCTAKGIKSFGVAIPAEEPKPPAYQVLRLACRCRGQSNSCLPSLHWPPQRLTTRSRHRLPGETELPAVALSSPSRLGSFGRGALRMQTKKRTDKVLRNSQHVQLAAQACCITFPKASSIPNRSCLQQTEPRSVQRDAVKTEKGKQAGRNCEATAASCGSPSNAGPAVPYCRKNSGVFNAFVNMNSGTRDTTRQIAPEARQSSKHRTLRKHCTKLVQKKKQSLEDELLPGRQLNACAEMK